MKLSAYELRRHLAGEHDVRIMGADYGTLVVLHAIEHRSPSDHEHEDGPGSSMWARECEEFGCGDTRADS